MPAVLNFAKSKDGTQLAYKIQGEGEPVLLVSGQGQDHHLCDPIIPLLASRYRLILFDNRGTGKSDKPSTPYSTELFADDAITVFDTIGVEKAHIVGIPNLFP